MGRSNVGKSTLLNRLVGSKLAIVSPKPQTTRSRILGIRTLPAAQIVWVDTPGLHAARSRLNRRLVDTASREAADADLAVGVVDAEAGFGRADELALAAVEDRGRPWVLAVNKIDRLRPIAMIPLLDRLSKRYPEVEIVPVSARTGKNVRELERTVASRLPAGPALFPADELTDQSARALVSEFVREQIFLQTDGEVPYATAVVIDTYEEKGRLHVVQATIWVERASQRAILLGAGGSRIREIGRGARLELEKFFRRKFFLELFVKVQERWSEKPSLLDELGL